NLRYSSKTFKPSKLNLAKVSIKGQQLEGQVFNIHSETMSNDNLFDAPNVEDILGKGDYSLTSSIPDVTLFWHHPLPARPQVVPITRHITETESQHIDPCNYKLVHQ